MGKPNGKEISCSWCSGHGLILDMHGEPAECSYCEGTGSAWRYPNGTLAQWYGGPLMGSDKQAAKGHPEI